MDRHLTVAATPLLVDDRRLTARPAMSTLVTGHNTSGHFVGRSRDITRNGMAVESNLVPRQGAILNLHFRLPGHADAVVCRGVVTRAAREAGAWVVVFLQEDCLAWEAAVEAFVQRRVLTGNA